MFGLPRLNKRKGTIVEFQFGAYYSIKEKGIYSIFRLLDLPGDSYHIQLILSGLTAEPDSDRFLNKKPEIYHVPFNIANLLGKEVKLLAHKPLTKDDFYGYSVYLEEMGAEETAIQEHFEQLIDLSTKPPQKMRLYQDGNVVSADHL